MPRDWVQWAAAILGVVIVVGVVGVLVADGVGGDGRQPMLEVTVHDAQGYASPTGWIVPATLRNEGSATAEAVLLVASAMVAGAEEEAEVAVDYAPEESEIKLALGFSARPEGEIEVRVVGFRLP